MYIDRPVRQPAYAKTARPARSHWDGVRDAILVSKSTWYGLGPAVLYTVGVGMVAWNYTLRLPAPINYSWFWAGMILCLLSVLAVGLQDRTRASHHALALAALGAAMWIPYFLRSPARLIFSDELYHYQVTQLMIEQGNRNLQVTNYPIPGEFPGLEFVTMTLMGATGLSLDWANRIVTLGVHMLIPILAYLIARGVGLGKRIAFVAAAIYITNTSFFFFHSVFSYETLGITLVLSFWVLIASKARVGLSRRDLALMVPMLIAVAVTHHVSSYMLAISLVIAWFTTRFIRKVKAPTLGVAALLSIIFPMLWLLLGTVRTVTYLSTSIGLRFQTIVNTIFGEQTTTRALFKASPLPPLERLIDYAYAPLLLLLALIGLFIIWRHGKWRFITPLMLGLAVFGPLLWSVSTPAILTRASDMVYRSWPFLFIGMGVYGGLSLVHVSDWIGARFRVLGRLLVLGVITVLFVGGISLGDNQGGRFNDTEPKKAAGPETITADVVSAAKWLEHTAGRYNMIASDVSTQTAFATYGFQRTPKWENWAPFLDQHAEQVNNYMKRWGTQYIVVDDRITQLLPRYQYYFGQAEVFTLAEQGYSTDRPFPKALIDKFNDINTLSRIYDNGNLQIYGHGQPPTVNGSQPAGGTTLTPAQNPQVSR